MVGAAGQSASRVFALKLPVIRRHHPKITLEARHAPGLVV
jgi:hypothetical protein